MSNTFGKLFKLHSFGESHGSAVGGIIEGMPAGFKINVEALQTELNRRKANTMAYSTSRMEPDELVLLSGIENGLCLGSPIGFLIWNTHQKPKDYQHLADSFRPSHADFTYLSKYGIQSKSGGGRSSARETLSRVVAGAMAQQVLKTKQITVHSWIQQIGTIQCKDAWDFPQNNSTPVCPEPEVWNHMLKLIEECKMQGDTLGGRVRCKVTGIPPGLGEPVFDKLQARLGQAIFSIPTVKALSFSDGIGQASMLGSETNDVFYTSSNGTIATKTNHSGGIQGGISNGMPLLMEAYFKPISSIQKPQDTVTKDGTPTQIQIQGRHDVCVLPRVLPVVEAMTAMVVLDFWLLQQSRKS